jgi:hypothetical protein
MATEVKAAESEQDPTIRNYFLICMGGMGILLLLLLRSGLGPLSLAPVIVGVVGAAFRLRSAPLLTLIVLAGTQILQDLFQQRTGFSANPATQAAFKGSLADWIASAAVLAYFAGNYRLMGLTAAYFPEDRKMARKSPPEAAGNEPGSASSNSRSRKSIAAAEISWFILGLPFWALLAQIVWKLAPSGRNSYELEPAKWQGIVFAWMLALGWFVVAGFSSYVIWQQRTRLEATLLLQDEVWRQTCRDQRRIYRQLLRRRSGIGGWLSDRLRRRSIRILAASILILTGIVLVTWLYRYP